MTGTELSRLLVDAAGEAERSAPPLDPLRGLARARDRRRQRRGHLVVGAFVLFTFLLQAVPSDALGSAQPLHAAALSAGPAAAGGTSTATTARSAVRGF